MKRKILVLFTAGILLTSTACGLDVSGDTQSGESVGSSVSGEEQQSAGEKNEDISLTEEEQADFIRAETDFAVKLFQNSLKDDKNTMISPMSVLTALSMTANGAEGSTREQMLETFAGGQDMDVLNRGLYWWNQQLISEKDAKLSLANSIWFREDVGKNGVEQDFIQTNQKFYQAEIRQEDFRSPGTVKKINRWVSDATDGMIDEIIKEIPDKTLMYLMNGAAFDAKWAEKYDKNAIAEDLFFTEDGRTQQAKLMYSEEHLFLKGDQEVGFVKPYKAGYSFVALLPQEGIDMETYVESLNGEKFQKLLSDAQDKTVQSYIPEFSYEYETVLNDILIKMGMSDAFSGAADFSGIMKDGGLSIDEVRHKTFIAVDADGTKAGAVTSIAVKETAMPVDGEPEVVRLDRPFVYAVVDDGTNLPVFFGTVMEME